jgi:hypothetical protein
MWPQKHSYAPFANGGAAADQMESEKEECETAADLTASEKDALQKQARSTVLGKALLQSHLLSYLSSGEEEEESAENDEQLARRLQAEEDEKLEEVSRSLCQFLEREDLPSSCVINV